MGQMKPFLLGLLAALLGACSSTNTAQTTASGGTRYLDTRTGLIVAENGKPISPAQLRAEQQQALAGGHENSGGGFGAWLKEFYSVENVQKRMAIGAQIGAAASRSIQESRNANRSYQINQTGPGSWRVTPSY